MPHRFPIVKILWDFYGTFVLCISTLTALIPHTFTMTCSMGNLWDISVLIMTMKNHTIFTHCILRIVLYLHWQNIKYIPYCTQITYSIQYFDGLQFCNWNDHNKSIRIVYIKELNSNTLTCCSNKQKLDENFIEFLLTCSCFNSSIKFYETFRGFNKSRLLAVYRHM